MLHPSSPEQPGAPFSRRSRWLLVAAVAAIALPFALAASFEKASAPLKEISPLKEALSAEEIAWARQMVGQFPEIGWLADPEVRKTEEGREGALSYSEALYGKKYPELDRTLLTLRCLSWVIEGSEAAYHHLVQKQPAEVRLSREHFYTLHDRAKAFLHSKVRGLSPGELRQILFAGLVLGDMGKSPEARKVFAAFGVSAPDHDQFLKEAMGVLKAQWSLCPTYEKLSHKGRFFLSESIALDPHRGHITHLEGTPGSMFGDLAKMGGAEGLEALLTLGSIVHMADVMGALGHVEPRSSLVYTDPVFAAKSITERACLLFVDPKMGEKEAYQFCLVQWGQTLGIDPDSAEGRIAIRLGAMCRLATPEQGALLKGIVAQMPKEVLTPLDPFEDDRGIATPTYIPAVLVNLLGCSKAGESFEARLTFALQKGLPLISAVLTSHQRAVEEGTHDPALPLNFNPIAKVAKEAPELLSSGRFNIDGEGNITIVEE